MLEEVLNTLGVESSAQLTELERKTFERWAEAWEGRDFNQEKVTTFISSEMYKVDSALVNPSISPIEDIFLKCQKRILMVLAAMMNNNENTRDAVRREMALWLESKKKEKSLDEVPF